MAKYVANGILTAVTTSYKTPLAITGGTGVRPKVYQFGFSCPASADKALDYLLQRTTAAGTGTSVTPNPLDPADPAAEVTAKEDHSGEPTYGSEPKIIRLAQHQKSSLYWQAYDDDARIVIPASSGAGLGLQIKSTDATPQVNAHMAWGE